MTLRSFPLYSEIHLMIQKHLVPWSELLALLSDVIISVFQFLIMLGMLSVSWVCAHQLLLSGFWISTNLDHLLSVWHRPDLY